MCILKQYTVTLHLKGRGFELFHQLFLCGTHGKLKRRHLCKLRTQSKHCFYGSTAISHPSLLETLKQGP